MSGKQKKKRILFLFKAPNAEKVFLAGSFNGWNTSVHPMQKDGEGTWSTALQLFPGQYEYKFFVDNQWKDDPKASRFCLNRYGCYNSELNVE